MGILGQILENLELERDLGTRTVEIDRALLVPPVAKPVLSLVDKPAPTPSVHEEDKHPVPSAGQEEPEATPIGKPCDILFLTGRPLSAAGDEAVRKTIAAMKRIKADIDVRLNAEVPAKVIILLGSDALKRRVPSAAQLMRGRWMTVDGVPAMPTFSPDYIFAHFQEGSAGMVAAKRSMWADVKAALDRL